MAVVKLSNLCCGKLYSSRSSSFWWIKPSAWGLALKHSGGTDCGSVISSEGSTLWATLFWPELLVLVWHLGKQRSLSFEKVLVLWGFMYCGRISATLQKWLVQVMQSKNVVGAHGLQLATEFLEAFWAPLCRVLVRYGADVREARLLLLQFCSAKYLQCFFSCARGPVILQEVRMWRLNHKAI